MYTNSDFRDFSEEKKFMWRFLTSHVIPRDCCKYKRNTSVILQLHENTKEENLGQIFQFIKFILLYISTTLPKLNLDG